jgi:hypothetical protein
MAVFLLRDSAGVVYALSGQALSTSVVQPEYAKEIDAAFMKIGGVLPSGQIFAGGDGKKPPKGLADLIAGYEKPDKPDGPKPPKLEFMGAIEDLS